jgi:transcriptional regulator with XRE-family HTH domain
MKQAMPLEWRDRLRLAVDLSGKKHSAIAHAAEITPGSLSRILTGRRRHPQFETVVRIVHACGEKVGWILGEDRAPLSADETERMREIAAFLGAKFPP